MYPGTAAALAALAATSGCSPSSAGSGTGPGSPPNLGAQAPAASLPFQMTQVASFDTPWRLAFLPDGRMLVTEKPGGLWLVTPAGAKTPVAGAPAVVARGQGGMLGVFVSPDYARDHSIYLTYSEPAEVGSSLALARARLALTATAASLEGL